MSWFKKEAFDATKQIVIGVGTAVLTAIIMIAVEAARDALKNKN